MALTQTGENQRKIGVNLSKIIGLKNTPEKMNPLNMERQKGGYNAVGYNANGQPCGCGNGAPNGGGGSGGGSGGGDTPPVSFPCSSACVTLAEAAEMYATGEKPCCISNAKNCETGEEIKICFDFACVETQDKCDGGSCDSMSLYILATQELFYGCGQRQEIVKDEEICLNPDEIQSLREKVLQQKKSEIKSCSGLEVEPFRNEITGNSFALGFWFSYGGYGNYGNYGLHQKSANCTDDGCNNRRKYFPKFQKFYFSNGQFYNECNPFQEPTKNMTVCDEDGNQYQIGIDNVGNPKVTPV